MINPMPAINDTSTNTVANCATVPSTDFATVPKVTYVASARAISAAKNDTTQNGQRGDYLSYLFHLEHIYLFIHHNLYQPII